jgi:hypothetical protein
VESRFGSCIAKAIGKEKDIMAAYATNFFVWGVLAFITLFLGYYAFVRPHRPDSTPPKDRSNH